MDDFIKGTTREKKALKNTFESNLLYFRWVFILFVFPVFYLISDDIIPKPLFLKVLAFVTVYNLVITVYILKKSEKKRKVFNLVFYVDIVVISLFAYVLGGIRSDIYIIYFFIIGYYGISNDVSHTINISIFSIATYSITCFVYELGMLAHFNFWILILRDFFILIAAYGISLVIVEVKKYDEMHKREFKLARTDKLTGLPNRHYMEQRIKEELEYSDCTGKPLNILIFDLDNFKKFNDSYGHLWGDKLLSLFADILRQSLRKLDVPVRYGGEEFLVIIRDLDINMAKSVGERIRRQLERQRLYVGSDEDKKKVTVSCGVAQYPFHSKSIKEVMDYADKALYHAKEIGKNIVVTYDEIGKYREVVQIDIDSYMSS